MQPHQQRVVNEKEDLDERREKLDLFLNGNLFTELDPAEQARLRLQASLMKMLSDVLEERICAFSE